MNITKILIIFLPIFFIFSCKNKEEKKVDSNQKAIDNQNQIESVFTNIFIEKNPNKNYVIGNWNKEKNETHFKYLGSVTTKKKENLTLVNSIYYFGEISKKARNNIMIFQDDDKYIGYYNIAMTNDLPTKFENGFLYFENDSNDCDKNNEFKIDFRNGIPEKIFRKCKGELGDLYEFKEDE